MRGRSIADDRATTLDIVLACQRIARFLDSVDKPTFLKDEQRRWAVVSQLSIIGEAVRRLSSEFRDARPQIPWRQIAGMCDRLIHAYEKINWTLVWQTASHEVPALLAELELSIPQDDSPP